MYINYQRESGRQKETERKKRGRQRGKRKADRERKREMNEVILKNVYLKDLIRLPQPRERGREDMLIFI